MDFLNDERADLYTNFKQQYTALLFIMQRVATGENFLTVSRPDETESALLDLVDDELRPAQRPRHPKRLACASVFDCNNLAVNATPRCHQDSKRSIGESSAGANTFVAMCPAFWLRRNEEDHPHEIIRLSGGMHSSFMQVKEAEYVEVEEFQINFVIQLGQAWWLNLQAPRSTV